MRVKEVVGWIEDFAAPALQESYDNSGLIVGDPSMEVRGVLLCIDVTEAVIDEAIANNLNLIIAHHPLIFSGLKRITGNHWVQRCVIKAIKADIAIFAAHTNIDSVLKGVNDRIAEQIGLVERRILRPKAQALLKLVTFVPQLHVQRVREALFAAGAGSIGNYDDCSFESTGKGSFRANDQAQPFVGEAGKLHFEAEVRLEVILPDYLRARVVQSLYEAHPYEEPAYDLIRLENEWERVGAGLVGRLPNGMSEADFMQHIRLVFGNNSIRHTAFRGKTIEKVALCGGSGSFLLQDAKAQGADVFISGDFKYHDFFEADGDILIADPGHYEMEQFTKELFFEVIQKKNPIFAVQISQTSTNPIIYL